MVTRAEGAEKEFGKKSPKRTHLPAIRGGRSIEFVLKFPSSGNKYE